MKKEAPVIGPSLPVKEPVEESLSIKDTKVTRLTETDRTDLKDREVKTDSAKACVKNMDDSSALQQPVIGPQLPPTVPDISQSKPKEVSQDTPPRLQESEGHSEQDEEMASDNQDSDFDIDDIDAQLDLALERKLVSEK